MKKKGGLLLIALILAFIISMPTIFCSSEKAEANNGTDYSSYASITNFVINTQADFRSFASSYNNKPTYNFSGKTVTLNCDIDLVDTAMFFVNFHGVFEGNGHKIYNQSQALFGNIGTVSVFPQVGNINFVNATNNLEYLMAENNYGTISNINYWGNFAPKGTAAIKKFMGIVKNNFGTMSNCTNFGAIVGNTSAKISGVTENNYGTLNGCSYLGDIVLTVFAEIDVQIALIAYNNFITNTMVTPAIPTAGLINSSMAFANITLQEDSAPVVQPLICLLAFNSGTVNNSSIAVCMQKEDTTIVNNNLVPNIYAGASVLGSYAAYGDSFIMYDLSGTLTNFTDNWQAFLVESNLGTQFYYYYNTYPVSKSFYPTSGSSLAEELTVNNLSDIYKLRVFWGGDNIYAKLTADNNLKGMPLVTRLATSQSTLYFEGQNFAFYQSDKQYIFDQSFDIICQNLGCLATVTVENVSQANSDDVSIYYDNNSYRYGFIGEEFLPITPSESLIGAGTRSDPYKISSANDLAKLDNLEGFALLKNDIVINSAANANNSLPLIDLRATLLGGGYSIIGIVNQSFVVNNHANIYNLFIRGYIDDGASSIVCTNNYGKIADVIVSGNIANIDGSIVAANNIGTITDTVSFGSVSGDNAAGITTVNGGALTKVINYATVASALNSSSGIAYQNTGSILLSQNYGTANFGITANQQGTVANTINFALATFADSYTGINTSFTKQSGSYRLINNGLVSDHLKLDYLTMNAANYDMTTVFGYEVNTFLDYPTLKTAGKKYKTSLATPFRNYPFGTKTYNSGASYFLEDIELYIKTGGTASASFVWSYNGQPFHGEYLQDAGSYVATANYLGDGNYLPARSVQTFVINKAVPPLALDYQNFADINVNYNGVMLEIVTSDPENKEDLDNYGYIYSESFSKGGVTISPSEIIKPAIYKQTVTFRSTNYFDLTANRNITISKANLTLTVGDYQIDYLQSIVWENVGVTLNGLVAADSEKAISDLVSDYTAYFTTNYINNSNVGQYDLGFSLLTVECYNIAVTTGTLTVKAIDLLQGDIFFYFATKETNGSTESFYNGESQSLVATNIGEGVSVEYQNNSNKDVGYYFPKAIFSKPNYNNLELVAYFEIKKIPLTLTVTDLTKGYGYQLSLSDFACVPSGLVFEDTLQSVFVTRPFTYKVYDDEILVSQGDILDAKNYRVELSIGGNPPTNYTVNIDFGTLSITQTSLVYLYSNNILGQSSSFDDHTYTYSGGENSREIDYFEDNEIFVSIVYKYYYGETLLPSTYAVNAGVYNIVATVTPLGNTAVNFLETFYTCIMTIDKMTINLQFSQADYTFTYASEIYGIAQNFDYEGDLPEGTSPIFACTKGGVAVSAKDAGQYNLSYTLSESDNYYGVIATATLNIMPKEIGVGVVQNYVYTAAAIALVVEIMGVIDDEINYSNLDFSYKNAGGNTVSAITAVGSYTCSVAIIDSNNYILSANSYPVTVSAYTIYFEWGTLEYVYGTTGEYSYNGRNYLISSTRVTLRNYLTDLNTNIDIAVTFVGSASGQFAVEESHIVQLINYNILFTEASKNAQLNKISVTKRPLSVIWRLDGLEYYNQSYQGFYTGLSQNSRWTYVLGNFAFNDSAADVSIDRQVLGGNGDIYHTGDYTILLTILNNLNYVLTNSSIAIRVEKGELVILVNDATVERGESYNYPSLSVSGRVGADINKSVDTLDLSSITMITEYSPQSSPIGGKYSINVVATFRNYTAIVLRTGVLTVVANLYPDYNLSDVVYVYDGTEKTVIISNVASGVGVVYSNNIHKNAGVYIASAVISYPSGRTKVSTCTITIIRATPTITLTPNNFVYTQNRLLLPEDIIGEAKHHGTTVVGSYQFVEESYLLLGAYSLYEIRFIPDDTQNYNEVNSFYTINSVEIDFRVFVFEKFTDIVFISETQAEISAPVVVTLKNVLNGISLYRDGSKFDSIVLDKTAKVRLQIRYRSDIVYAAEWDVVYVETDQNEEIIINEKLLELSGVSFNQDVINVNALGGRIKLADKYKDDYALFVNGIELNEYIVNGNEESVIIMIKSKTIANLTLFAREYTVETVIIDNDHPKRSYTTYFIVGGSVLGGLAIIGVILLIIKKRKYQ